MAMAKNSFRWRAFVSLLLLLSFLLSALSGVILFLRPEGSLAAWSGWSALGLDKKDWEELHAVAIVFFLACSLCHLAWNWRALLAYCRRKKEETASVLRGPGGGRELVAALLLSGLVLAAALCRWPPARWIAGLRAGFKSGAGIVAVRPPAADVERLTMAELCPLLGMDEPRLLAVARAAGIRVENSAQTLAAVARVNGLSPEKVYAALKGKR